MNLPTAVYTAYRGYAWSRVPQGLTLADLDRFNRMVALARGDFPDPLAVETGLVSDGRLAAAFTIQNISNWDANGRAADYGAYVFFPVAIARMIDFTSLISTDYFWTPSRTPPAYLDYRGIVAEDFPPEAAAALQRDGRLALANPRMIGSMLTSLGSKSGHWTCLVQDNGSLDIRCDTWE